VQLSLRQMTLTHILTWLLHHSVGCISQTNLHDRLKWLFGFFANTNDSQRQVLLTNDVKEPTDLIQLRTDRQHDKRLALVHNKAEPMHDRQPLTNGQSKYTYGRTKGLILRYYQNDGHVFTYHSARSISEKKIGPSLETLFPAYWHART
jgi:hypothetical protein